MRQHTHLMGKRLLSSALAILLAAALHCSGCRRGADWRRRDANL